MNRYQCLTCGAYCSATTTQEARRQLVASCDGHTPAVRYATPGTIQLSLVDGEVWA